MTVYPSSMTSVFNVFFSCISIIQGTLIAEYISKAYTNQRFTYTAQITTKLKNTQNT